MSIFEAIKWLSPKAREDIIYHLEEQDLDGIEVVDLVVGHFNMACDRILKEMYRLSDYDELTDALKKLLTSNN